MFKKIMIKATDDTDDTFKPVPTFFLTDNPLANTNAGTHTSTPIQPHTPKHTHSKVPHPPTQTRTDKHTCTHIQALTHTHAHTQTHMLTSAHASQHSHALSHAHSHNCKHTLSLFNLVVTQNLSLSHTTVISQDHKPTKRCLLEKH